ncbi:hypothetical protein [Cetobacterium sp.]
MLKKIVNILIIFLFISFNLFSEIINEKIFDNPIRKVTTIETKKEKEKANLNITVNKINPVKISGTIENNELVIPLSSDILKNSDNSYFIPVKSLKDIPNIVNKDKLFTTLKRIDSSNFQKFDFNKKTLRLKVKNNEFNEGMLIYKIDLQSKNIDKVFQLDKLERNIVYHDAGTLNLYVDSTASGSYIKIGGDMGTAPNWQNFNNPTKTHPLLYHKVDNINIEGRILEVVSINDRNNFQNHHWYNKTYHVFFEGNGSDWRRTIMYPRQEYNSKDDFFNVMWASMNTLTFRFKIRTNSTTKEYQSFTINIYRYDRNIFNGTAILNLKDLPNNSWAGWNPEVGGQAAADFKEHSIDRAPILSFSSSNLFNTMGVANKSILNKLTITKNGSTTTYDNIQEDYFKTNRSLTHTGDNYDLHFTSNGKFYITKKNGGTYTERVQIRAEYLGKALGSLDLTVKNEEFVFIDLPDVLDFGYMIFDPYNNYLEVEDIFQVNNINDLNISLSLREESGEMTLVNDSTGAENKKIPLLSVKLESLGKNVDKRVEMIKLTALAKINKDLVPGDYQGTVNLIVNIE